MTGFLHWFFGEAPRRPKARPGQRADDQRRRAHLRAVVPPLLEKWEPLLEVTAAEWRIKRMKTRWGSCNTRDRRIWLSLNLADKPLPCIEYVLVHELVHLLEPSHNARFKALMTRFLPDWKQRNLRLR